MLCKGVIVSLNGRLFQPKQGNVLCFFLANYEYLCSLLGCFVHTCVEPRKCNFHLTGLLAA